MKRIRLIIILALVAVTICRADTYLDYLKAGKTAKDDKNFELARSFYKQALSMVPEDSIEDRYLLNMRLQMLNLVDLNNFEEALVYGKNRLEIFKSVTEPLSPNLVEPYNLIALTYANLKDKKNCYLYLDSVTYCVPRPYTQHLDEVIQTLNNIAMIEKRFEDWEEADKTFKTLLKYSEMRPLCDMHLKYLNLYANNLYRMKKIPEARAAYTKRMELTEQLHGKDSEDYRWAYYNVANILAYDGDTIEGGRYYMDVAAQYRDELTRQLRYLPSEKRQPYLRGTIDIIYNMIPFGIEAKFNEDDFTEMAYNGLLLTKGLLLASEKSRADIISRYGTGADKEKLRSMNTLQHTLTELMADPQADPSRTASVFNGIKRLDAELAESCAQYGNLAAFADITYKDVKAKLKDDEVLLDFADFKPLSKPRQYVCFEIRRNQTRPKVHYVCNGSELDSLLTLEGGVWSNLYSGEAAADMARIVGRPLAAIIGDARTVYYVPSGVFHKLAVEAVPMGDEDAACDRFDFRRLSSARELLSPDRTLPSSTAQLYGGLNYDYGIAEPPSGKRLKELPRSLKEVREISRLMGADKVTLLTGDLGVKSTFLGMDGRSPDVLHLSTHGYYYAPDDRNLPASLKGYDDAMSLSGLYLTGGNRAFLGLEKGAGMLSAEEISHCDLQNLGLVCLASCHSGQGEVTSEGIYGLQRAFKKAGAGSIVMNLWEASDVATECFMTNFYTDLLTGSRDRRKAFSYARDQVRKKYPSPFYWAGFTMID